MKAMNTEQSDSAELNLVFEKIFNTLVDQTLGMAGQSVQRILTLSSHCISLETHDALSQFYELYFKESHEIQQRKNDANRSVDDLIDQIQSGHTNIAESQESSDNRLGLSGLQKKLEAIVSLQTNLKAQLAPILSSMQFEDAARQRMQHVASGIQMIISHLNAPLQAEDTTTAQEIADLLSSSLEVKDYYRLVLKEDPPEMLEDQSIWFDFA